MWSGLVDRDGAAMLQALVQKFISWQSQELDKFIVSRDLIKQLSCRVEFAGSEPTVSDLAADFLQLSSQHRPEQLFCHFPSVCQSAAGMANPLPHLSARDFRGSRVFHQVEDRDGAMSPQPGF